MKKLLVVFLSLCLALGSCVSAFAVSPVGSASIRTAAGRSTPVPTRASYSHYAFDSDQDPAIHSASVTTPTPAPKPTLSPEQKKRLAQLENELKKLTEKKNKYEEIVAPFRAMASFMALLVRLHKTYGIQPAFVIELMRRLRLPIPIFPFSPRDLEDVAFYTKKIERLEQEISRIKEEIRKIKEGKV